MALTADDLAAIDRQLDALGKSDAEISAIVARARAIVASLEDVDAALEELAAGRAIPVASPRRERPEEPSTDVHAALFVEAQHGVADDRPARTSDIAGLSVDELFADAEPSAAPAQSGLAGLFDDEPLSLSESELGLDVGDAAALYDEQGLADALEDDELGALEGAPGGLADALEDDGLRALEGAPGGLADALEDDELGALEGAPLRLADALEDDDLGALEGAPRGLADALEADELEAASPRVASPVDDDEVGDEGGLAEALAHARAADVEDDEDDEDDWPAEDTGLMRAIDFEGVLFEEAERAPALEVSADLVVSEPAPRPRTMPPPVPSHPPPESLGVIGEEDDEEATNILTGADFARLTGAASHSDEFELLVDEEILEIDDDELEEMPDEEDEPGPDDENGERRGLFRRILGRK